MNQTARKLWRVTLPAALAAFALSFAVDAQVRGGRSGIGGVPQDLRLTTLQVSGTVTAGSYAGGGAPFASATHTHGAADITSGTFADARIAASNVTQHQGALSLGAGQITTGTFADARIAASNVTQHQGALSLGAGQITTGTFADARIAASNVTQHQAALSLAGTQITSGTVADARLSSNVALRGAINTFTEPQIIQKATAGNVQLLELANPTNGAQAIIAAANIGGAYAALAGSGDTVFRANAGDLFLTSISGLVGLSPISGAGGLTLNSAGNVNVIAPASGTAATINAVSGARALTLARDTTAGQTILEFAQAGSRAYQILLDGAAAQWRLRDETAGLDRLTLNINGEFAFNATPVAGVIARFQQPAQNEGLEVGRYGASEMFLQAYNRTGAVYNSLLILGSGLNFFRSSTGHTEPIDYGTYRRIKTAVTSRASTATPTADPDLSATINAGSYIVRVRIQAFTTDSARGIRYRLNGTATHSSGRCSNRRDDLNTSLSWNVNHDWSSFGGDIILDCGLTFSAGGTVQLEWSQVTSGAAATEVAAGSFMTIEKVN